MSELSAFIWPQTSPVEEDETLGWGGWQQGLPRREPHSPKATPALESPWISGACRLTASRATLGRVQATRFSLGQPPPLILLLPCRIGQAWFQVLPPVADGNLPWAWGMCPVKTHSTCILPHVTLRQAGCLVQGPSAVGRDLLGPAPHGGSLMGSRADHWLYPGIGVLGLVK